MIWLFLRSPLGRWIAGAVALVLILGALALWQRHIGAEKVIETINQENDDAGNAADAAAFGLTECLRNDGMFWDFGAGKCRRSEARDR